MKSENAYSHEFRECETTGLKVHLPAQRLIWIHAVSAVVFLLIGGVLALLIGLTKWPQVHLLPMTWFYRLVSAHGVNMLVFWIVFFEMAGLVFGASVVLGARFPAIKLAWFNWILMITGAIMTNIVMFMGKADVMFTAYVPLKAHPLFYLGIILFAVGALGYSIHYLVALGIAKKEGWYAGSLPLVSYGLAAAAIIAVFTLLMGAIAFVPAFLWSLGLIDNVDPVFFRLAFWGFGHPAQQINLAAMVSVWYLLAHLTVGAKPVNQVMCRLAFILYLVGINLGSIHHLLVDPGLTATFRIFNTSYMFYAAVIGSLIHAFSIPAAVETVQRKRGLNRGLFEWLTKGPWSNPAWSGFVISFVIFGFIGGVTGVIMSVPQLNLVQHNTLRVTGHFHGTVVGGTTLAFMALTYYLIPLVLQRRLVWPKVARYQPYVFAFGILLVIAGMTTAGIMGAPRRHWDITFSNAVFQVPFSPAMNAMLALVGIGAVIAVTGLMMFIGNAVASVFFGEKIPAKMILHTPPYEQGETVGAEPLPA